MTLEDYTTYTEVEPDDRIQKTANHVDFRSYREEDAYLYKDKGVNHFGDFDHKVDAKCIGETTWTGIIWGLANALDDLWALFPMIAVQMHDSNNKIYLRENYDATKYNDESTDTFAHNTMYYFRIKKSGTALTCDVYASAADRDAETSKITNLCTSLTLQADHQFRYIYACSTIHYDATSMFTDFDIENLNLQEPILLTITDSMGMNDSVAKQFDAKKTITDSVGMLDSQVPKWDAHLTITDKLGMVDTATRVKNIFQTISDILGLTDTTTNKGAFKQAIIDILGMLDTATRGFPLAVTITEILGIRDRLITKKRRFPLPDLPDHTTRGGAPE